MVAADFEKTLRAFVRRKPIKTFQVELVSGDRIVVDHPEALVFRAGTAIYLNPEGEWTIFDNEGVAQFTDAPALKRPKTKKVD